MWKGLGKKGRKVFFYAVIWSFCLGGLIQAQNKIPFSTAMQTLGIAGGFSVVVVGDIQQDVVLPTFLPDPRDLAFQVAFASGVQYCEKAEVIIFGGGCEPDNSEVLEIAEVKNEQNVIPEISATITNQIQETVSVEVVETKAQYAFELSSIQINDSRLFNGGASQRSPAGFELLGTVGYEWLTGLSSTLSITEFVSSLDFIESSGIGRRSDEIKVLGVEGSPVSFSSGGAYTLSLLSDNGTIERSIPYGLDLGLTANSFNDSILLDIVYTSSAPANVADASFLDISSRNYETTVMVKCGEVLNIGSLFQNAVSYSGSGFPYAAGLPAAGFLFGESSDNEQSSLVIYALSIGCFE